MLTLQNQKHRRGEQVVKGQDVFESMIERGKSKAVNPFLTMMVLRITLKSWRNIATKEAIRQELRNTRRMSKLQMMASPQKIGAITDQGLNDR